MDAAQEGGRRDPAIHAEALAAKTTLRRKMTKVRKDMTPEARQAASAQMIDRLVKLQAYQNAQTIFAYASMADEVQLDAFIERAMSDGKRVAIPWITDKGTMEAVEVSSLKSLEVGMYGIRNVPAAERRVIAPEAIDLAIVPGAAFTVEGARLGLGGGYYDRYLGNRAPQAERVALAFDALVLPRPERHKIPMEAHDIWADVLVTETRVLSFDKRKH